MTETPACNQSRFPERTLGRAGGPNAVPLGTIDRPVDLTGRRVLFAVLVVATIAVVLGLTAAALAADASVRWISFCWRCC